MVNEYPVTLPQRACVLAAEFSNLSGRLMPKHKRRLFLDVPGHDIAGTDTAGCSPDKSILLSCFRYRHLFNPYIVEVV
jgi:hypothetical protein